MVTIELTYFTYAPPNRISQKLANGRLLFPIFKRPFSNVFVNFQKPKNRWRSVGQPFTGWGLGAYRTRTHTGTSIEANIHHLTTTSSPSSPFCSLINAAYSQ